MFNWKTWELFININKYAGTSIWCTRVLKMDKILEKRTYVHCTDADGFSWHMDGCDARNGKKFLDSKHSPIFLMDLRISCGGGFYSLEYSFCTFFNGLVKNRTQQKNFFPFTSFSSLEMHKIVEGILIMLSWNLVWMNILELEKLVRKW